MRAWFRSILALPISACIAVGADPMLLNRLSPEAKVVFGANVSLLRQTSFGRLMLSQARSNYEQLAKIAQAAGFDPFRDGEEVVVASAGGPKDNRGLMLMRGFIDTAKIKAFAKESGSTVELYRGVPVVHEKQNSEGWLALLDSATAAAGDSQSIREMIDRASSGTGPDPKLLQRVQEISAAYDLWMVSAVPANNLAGTVLDQLLGGIMQVDIMRSAVETGGGFKLGPEIVIGCQAVTRTDRDAAVLADVVRFIIGMVQASAQKDPKRASSMALLRRLSLKVEGNVMKLSLSAPEADLEKSLQQDEPPPPGAATLPLVLMPDAS